MEYEEPQNALAAFRAAGIKISKLHLSSALKTRPTPAALAALEKFSDDVYLHQVIAREADGKLNFFRDLPDALAAGRAAEEWRIHFHVPLHAPAASPPTPATRHPSAM